MIPNKLEIGDTIGVISSSDPIHEHKLKDITKSTILMESKGFKIKFADNAFKRTLGYSASIKEKAEDIHKMFKNDEVKAIFFSTGGNNSNSLFDYIDFDLIKNNPKIICGFSDSISVLNMIYEKTGLVTFHGATFKSLTSWETEYGYEEVIKRFVNKSLELGKTEDEYITIKQGIGEGVLVGGNVNLFSRLICGKYNVDVTDKILFLEDLGVESEPAALSSYFYYMKQNRSI